MGTTYYTFLLSFFIHSVVFRVSSGDHLFCWAGLCLHVGSGYQIKPFSQRANPFQPRRAPVEQLGLGRVWHRALELTHMDQIQPWWPPKCPGEWPAVQTLHGGSTEHPFSLLTSLLLPHHPQAGFPHLFSFKKSLKSAGLKVPACLTSHKSYCFLMLCKSASKY